MGRLRQETEDGGPKKPSIAAGTNKGEPAADRHPPLARRQAMPQTRRKSFRRTLQAKAHTTCFQLAARPRVHHRLIRQWRKANRIRHPPRPPTLASASPTVARREKALVEPSVVDCNRGWAKENETRQKCIYTNDDAVVLIEDLRTRITARQTVLVAQQAQAAFMHQCNNVHYKKVVARLMQQPAQPVKKNESFDPLG